MLRQAPLPRWGHAPASRGAPAGCIGHTHKRPPASSDGRPAHPLQGVLGGWELDGDAHLALITGLAPELHPSPGYALPDPAGGQGPGRPPAHAEEKTPLVFHR